MERMAYAEAHEHHERDARLMAKYKARHARSLPPTFQDADEAAADGSMLAVMLEGAVERLNAMRGGLDPQEFDHNRFAFGDEAAVTARDMALGALAQAEAFLSGLEKDISGTFVVSGTLVQRPDGGSASLGAYALSLSRPDFSIRIGSDGSAYIAQEDGSYRPFKPN